MRAYEMIVQMRSRLRDDASEGWSDAELLSSINYALSAIARKLRLWKGRFNNTTLVGVDTYSIPEDFMSPISFIYNGVDIPIQGIEWALSNSSDEACVFIDNDALIIYPVPTSTVPFVLNFHANRLLTSTGDTLAISDEYSDTVLFYALSLSYQKQASEESLAQSKYYLNLYREQLGEMQDMATMRRGARRVKTTYQKV